MGLPGSGKTALAHAVAGLLRDRGASVREPTFHLNHEMGVLPRQLAKIRYSLALVLLKPGWACSWLRAILASGQKTIPAFIGMLINCFHILEIRRRSGRRSGFYILDQGIFQAVWSLGQESGRDVFSIKAVGAAVRLVAGRGCTLAYVTADAASVVRRLRERKRRQSRMETGKHEPGLRDTVVRAQRQMERWRRLIRDNLPAVDMDECENGDGVEAAGLARTIAERAVRNAGGRVGNERRLF
jgi:hypothetical protein